MQRAEPDPRILDRKGQVARPAPVPVRQFPEARPCDHDHDHDLDCCLDRHRLKGRSDP
jgi:hypothetical protein